MSREIDLKVAKHVMKFGGDVERSEHYWDDLNFHPSTNIADAWRVVDKLYIAVTPQQGAPKELSYYAEIDKQPRGNYYAVFAETAPMAICLVALQSVGVK